VVLDKAKSGFILADNVGTKALASAFFTEIVFVQGIAALAERVHDQLAFFHLGYKIIRLLRRRWTVFVMGHPFVSSHIYSKASSAFYA
jgi:hypothetical protein